MTLLTAAANAEDSARTLRAGIIGLDTSHSPAFTNLLNDPQATSDLAGVRIVAAFPGGSPDIPESSQRVAGFTKNLQDAGVEMVDSVEALLPKVDVVLIESVDGRPHLEYARKVIQAGKPVFVDKPVAGSLADAIEIYHLAKAAKVPVFSSSAMRFCAGVRGMNNDDRVGKVLGCEARSPCVIEPHHPDLFWYGIHGVETLYTIMGPGCVSVTRTHTPEADVVVGLWKDGRIGTFRGLRGDHARTFGATVFGDKGIAPSGGFEGYKPLVVEIVKFFKTGKPPVDADETLEILAFMEAADESKRLGGASVTLQSVFDKATAAK